jgi:hypothetical protein
MQQLQNIDVNSLSSKDIDSLIQLLQKSLSEQDKVEPKKKTNVAVAVKESFNVDWNKTQEELNELFEYDLKKQAKAIAIDSILNAILSKHFDSVIVGGFFESIKQSRQAQNFNKTRSFAKTTPCPGAIILCSYLYRLMKVESLSNEMRHNFYGKPDYLRSIIKEYRDSSIPVIQDIINDFDSISDDCLDEFITSDKEEVQAAPPITKNTLNYLEPCNRNAIRYRFVDWVKQGRIPEDFPPCKLTAGYRKAFQCEPIKNQHTCVYSERELSEALKNC